MSADTLIDRCSMFVEYAPRRTHDQRRAVLDSLTADVSRYLEANPMCIAVAFAHAWAMATHQRQP